MKAIYSMSVCKSSGEYFLFGKYYLFFFEWEEARSDLAARNFEAMIYMKRFVFFFRWDIFDNDMGIFCWGRN